MLAGEGIRTIMRVIKFGGTSVGSINALRHMMDIITTKIAQQESLIIVCSAMSTVTDALFDAASLAADGHNEYHQIIKRIYDKHTTAVYALIKTGVLKEQAVAAIDALTERLNAALADIYSSRALTEQSRDEVLSFGELLSCQMIAFYLSEHNLPARFVDARTLIKTTHSSDVHEDHAKSITVDFKHTEKSLKQWLSHLDYLPVVTGYIASDVNSNITTTLGRGGSDYTATIIGAMLSAEFVEIWTDVDGVMTADPKHVKNTHTIPELSYVEAIKLSQAGAKVIYSLSLFPVQEKKIPLVVKNTFNASHAGTLIM